MSFSSPHLFDELLIVRDNGHTATESPESPLQQLHGIGVWHKESVDSSLSPR